MEDNRNISHKEDQKERIQGLYKFWNDCGKGFNTQTSLQKHRYLHRQLKLVSDMCGQGFTFISRLNTHVGQHEGTELQFVLFFLCFYFIIGGTKINTSINDN